MDGNYAASPPPQRWRAIIIKRLKKALPQNAYSSKGTRGRPRFPRGNRFCSPRTPGSRSRLPGSRPGWGLPAARPQSPKGGLPRRALRFPSLSDVSVTLRPERETMPCEFSQGQRMKEGMSNNSTTSISQARKAVEQLKMEACMDRVKVSQAAADLLAYCEAHVREDPLIIPVPASENPFREKKFFCTIL
uniref:Guanine nucleotide-binding protein subunit gamma n=1 Tax=Felis catus TaxID=9685 RepID=A0ABI7YZR2_FELCA